MSGVLLTRDSSPSSSPSSPSSSSGRQRKILAVEKPLNAASTPRAAALPHFAAFTRFPLVMAAAAAVVVVVVVVVDDVNVVVFCVDIIRYSRTA